MSGVLSLRIASGLVAVSLAAAPVARAQPFQRIECSGDVTDALQRAINQDDGNIDHANIQLSDGTCILHETIEICNIEGLRIEGTGPGGTILQWLPDDTDDSDDAGPMFSLQNSAGVAFSGFSVCLGGTEGNTVTLDSVFDMYNACFDCAHGGVDRCYPSRIDVWGGGSSIGYYPGSLPHSHANSFNNIEIASCVGEWGVLNHGARIKLFGDRAQLKIAEIETDCAPSSTSEADLTNMYQNNHDEWERYLRADCYNEHHSFTDVSVSEFRDSAFVVEGRNSYGNTFTNVHCDGLFQKDTQGDGLAVDSGRVCVETGQNHWVLDDNANQMAHVHGYVGGNIYTTLPHGESLGASTQGTFFWYGGTAENLSDAVFVLGCGYSPIQIVGLAAKRCRALVKALAPKVLTSGLPLLVESVQFDTDGVHAWDQARSFFARNPYGVVVDFPYHGPLIIRDSVFGDCPVDGIPADVEPDNVSIYWNYLSPNDESGPRGSFIFESTAISSSRDNVFVPMDSGEGLINPIFPGIYPTTQEANLICTQTLETLPWHWESMPQHFTDLDVSQADYPPNTPLVHDLSRPSTSREYYLLHGDGFLGDFASGVVGQEIVLIGGADSTVTVVHEGGKIDLRQGNSYEMTHGHTLWLVYDPTGCWREIGRGENSF